MSEKGAYSVSGTIQHIRSHDPTFWHIEPYGKQLTDAKQSELTDCLLAHPDVVTHVSLASTQLTDETGIKLARYVAASSTIVSLTIYENQLGSETYLALAAALCVNSSLRILYMFDNQAVDRTRVDAAFVEALRLNPNRPARSLWWLYSNTITSVDFKRLKRAAYALGPPSMLSHLRHCVRT